MSETFLEKVTAKTREKVSRVKTDQYLAALRKKADKVRQDAVPHLFKQAISRSDRNNIIAEIKRASPSKGALNLNLDVAMQAKRYEKGRAAAISVLTEPDHFEGSIGDLLNVRKNVKIPVLRKDFIVDEFQIFEAAAAGADAILLIVAALSADDLRRLRSIAEEELGLDALVEVHDEAELTLAGNSGASIIGVNNRNLHSLAVSLDVSRELAGLKPSGSLLVAESGLTSRSEIDELKAAGFDGFLIGETLMRSEDPVGKLEELGA